MRIADDTLVGNHVNVIAAGDWHDAISLLSMDVKGNYAICCRATERTDGHL